MSETDKETSAFEKNTILGIIKVIECDIRANGMSNDVAARRWAQLGHFYGRMGDEQQQRFACKQSLMLNPGNAWAKNQLERLGL